MGYTTAFEGKFACSHAANKVIGEFLKAVEAGDRTAVPVFADWLTDHDDPRGEQVKELLDQSPDDMAAFWRLFGLKPEHAAFLTKFNRTRRMKRDARKAALLPD